MPEDLSATTILVPGGFHGATLARLRELFKVVRAPGADLAQIAPEDRAAVRGIAAATVIDAAFIDAFPNLEIIANFGVGYDGVDARHAAARGVMVTNTPDVLTEEVADTAVGLLINTVRELPRAEQWLREGRWVHEGPYPNTRATLRGRKVGIFGLGRIGKAIADRLQAFGLSIAYHNRHPAEGVDHAYYPTLVGLAEAVDTLICVAPATKETEKAINAEVLKALGPDGVFVNIGRGATVDEAALAAALADGTILAAGLDVFANEPDVPQALLDRPNAVLLPHVASASQHTRKAMGDLVVDNLVSWFTRSAPVTPVSETAGVKRAGR